MRNEALEEGRERSIREAALRMLQMGKYTPEEIAEVSGFSLDEIKKLGTP